MLECAVIDTIKFARNAKMKFVTMNGWFPDPTSTNMHKRILSHADCV